ncbi:MAG: ABC transporter ATP-binding protein [Eubacterium sp.]|nr:ABC transporter ATP-binding protein [Eubacterium sp.]
MKDFIQKKYNLFQNIIYVFKGVKEHKPYIIGLLFISMICTVGSRFVWLFLSKYIIEYIIAGMQISELIKTVIILVLIGIVCNIGLNAVNCWLDAGAFYVRPMFMLRRNKKHMNMSYENLEFKEVLDMIQKSRNATSWTEKGVEGIIRFSVRFFSDICTCIFAMIILGVACPVMIIVVLVVGIISFLFTDYAAKKEKYLTSDSVTYENNKNQYFNEITRDFAYGKDIRLYNCQNELVGTQYEMNSLLHNNVCKAKKIWIISDLFNSFFEMLREGVMYLVLIISFLLEKFGMDSFTLYIGCVRNFAQAFQTVLTVYSQLRQCSREVNDYRAFVDFCDQDTEVGREIEENDSYLIEFENVSFKYPSSDKYALKNLNIKIDPFQKLAVVGLNGAGKTTFIKLLLRLYEPTEGRILLNGVDVKEYSLKSYYSIFSPVFQDMECYAFSLGENVSMQIDTDRELAEKCLAEVGLENKLNEWKEGIDTPILKILNEDGILPSGGEKQKIALARALYKNSPVVILDEPTAALDALAENKLYEEFDKLVDKKTAIYISHRLASTRFCDVIAMFKDGEIIEYGNHDVLMKNQKDYSKMFEMQAHYYVEDVANG